MACFSQVCELLPCTRKKSRFSLMFALLSGAWPDNCKLRCTVQSKQELCLYKEKFAISVWRRLMIYFSSAWKPWVLMNFRPSLSLECLLIQHDYIKLINWYDSLENPRMLWRLHLQECNRKDSTNIQIIIISRMESFKLSKFNTIFNW